MALEALDRLIANKAWQRGEAKEVQAEASLVIRRYLEGQFDMRAAEKTTDEVVAMLGIPGPNGMARPPRQGLGPSRHGQVRERRTA